MSPKKPFGFDRYQRMKVRSADYENALARTNIAVRCWLHWAGKLPYDAEKLRAKHRRVLAWLLANHLVQAYYRRFGIDVRPFSIGGMYGYGFTVGAQSPSCLRIDIEDTAWVACGSVRVDPKNEEGRPFELAEAVACGEDPLWAVDRAAVVALGQRWLPKCPRKKCRHWADADVYLNIYQIITLLLVMGYLTDAILGTFVDCSEYGDNKISTHPLRLTGIIQEPCFTQEYFELGPTYRGDSAFAWIHRSSGEILFAGDKQPISYETWCGGSIERGIEYLCDRIEKVKVHSYK